MKVKKSTILESSLINSYPYNYRDAISCEFETKKIITPDEIQITFWTCWPTWVNALFKLRNLIVKPFGLKGGIVSEQTIKECIEKSECHELFSVSEKSQDETIIALDDKHLRAYFSVYIESLGEHRTKVTTATVVQFKYWLGYVYFYSICPFHHIIMKSAFKNTIKRFIEHS